MALGTGPLGYGDPDEAEDPPEDAQLLSTWVSPATKQYEIDPVRGSLAEVSPVRGRVIYCLTQRLGSSALLPDDGVEYPKRVDDVFVATVQSRVRAALRQLTDVERVMRIEAIIVEEAGRRSRFLIHYTDLTTGAHEALRF